MTQVSEVSSCHRKQWFQSRSKARDAMAALRRKKNQLGERQQGLDLAVYECIHCKGWHVGKKPRR